MERRLEEATRRNAKELLVLTGERPEVNPEVAERLRSWGHEDFTSYVVWACERALDRGILPHTNLGVLSSEDLGRLREVTASQGLMLESISERLMETVHAGSPTKHPAERLATIEAAGELRIPFTSGVLVGIGEDEEERVASLEAIAAAHERHGHIQEVILQNYVPHPKYYGQEVAEIADESSRKRWEAGISNGEVMPRPDWACDVTIEDMKRLIAETKRLMPDVGVQVPPTWPTGGRSWSRRAPPTWAAFRPTATNISPEHPFPSPHQVRKRLAPQGYALTERLCVYPQYLEPEWMEQGCSTWSSSSTGASSRARAPGGGRRRRRIPEVAPRAIERGRKGEALTQEELTALFAETRPDVIEEMRVAADELRAELAGETATFVVNRNVNFTNVCVVGCAFCGFGQGKRSPDAYLVDEDDFVARVNEAVDFGATEICMQGGIHPDYTLEHYGRWLRLAKDVAPQIHLHAYSPMEVHFMCERSGKSPDEVFEYLIECGLGLDARHGRRGAGRRRAPAHLAQQAAGRALGRDHRGLAPRRAALDLDGDVRAHRGAAGACSAHARGPRAAGADRGASPSSCRSASSPSTRCWGGRTGVEEISRREPEAHGRLPPRPGEDDHEPAGELGEDGPGRRDREPALGRERPRRHADGGEHLAHGRLAAWSPPGARAAGRGGPPRGRAPAQRTTLYEIVETY